MHGWLYTLWGRKAQLEGDLNAALKHFETALVYPDNYGEGRHYSAQEANIYYYMGLLFSQMNQETQAQAAWTSVPPIHQMTESPTFGSTAPAGRIRYDLFREKKLS